MNSHPVRRLLRKFAILAILVACLGFFTLSPSNGRAATCCTSCQDNYDSCVTGCGEPASGGCLFFCQRLLNRCNSTCDPGC